MLTCNRLQYCVGGSTFTHIDLFMCQAIIQHAIYGTLISNNYRLHGRCQMVSLSNSEGIQHEGRTTDSIIIHLYFPQTAHSFLRHKKGWWRAACGFRWCWYIQGATNIFSNVLPLIPTPFLCPLLLNCHCISSGSYNQHSLEKECM